MAQKEIQRRPSGPPGERFWRLDLNEPTLWQTAALVMLGFAIGAVFGLVFS